MRAGVWWRSYPRVTPLLRRSPQRGWWPGYRRRIRQLREHQHQYAATGGPCWRYSAGGRVLQAAVSEYLGCDDQADSCTLDRACPLFRDCAQVEDAGPH